MKRNALLSSGAGALVLAGVAAGFTSGMASAASTSSAPAAPAVVKTADSPEGKILVDGSGRTLYMYRPGTGTTPTCTGACAAMWPPDTTTGMPKASGVNASLLATTTRPDDHRTQVTFNKHPLYYFSGDGKPGEVKGQGLQHIWYVLNPGGNAVTSAPAPAPAPAPSMTGGSGRSGGGGGYGY